MTSKNPITNCKYKEWLTDYKFENCKLYRGEYGEFLASYITGEHDGFVLNLNGGWGTGKTQFLRRLYSLLCSKGHPTIYIDAWESDFSEVPLSVVSSELISQLSEINENIGDEFVKIQKFLGKALKGAVVSGAGALTKFFMNEASVGVEAAKSLFDKTDQDYLQSVIGNHVEQIKAIKNIRSQLAQLAQVLEQSFNYALPVVVLVDELDRCRPSYAIEMLEIIKHFFTTNNFVFVIATDSNQLQHSIKVIYGNEFDSAVYLKRFFDREARLDKPDVEMYISIHGLESKYSANNIELYPKISRNGITDFISWIVQIYDFTIRDIDQLLSKLEACFRFAESKSKKNHRKQYINIFTLTLVLAEMDCRRHIFIKDDFKGFPKTSNKMHSFTIERNPYDSSQATSFFNFASLMVHCSKMHEVILSNNEGLNEKTKILGANEHFHDMVNSSTEMTAFKTIISIYDKYLNEFRLKKSEFWLWDDYIRISKLAGWLK
ncbi:P-loop NTPase fold protein [Pseudoalteromonas sp. HF66]|uniref:KAP family P-loop NTPase fold protein n=1 Tax=Pseudoalteromonas sp. HF66 TaxID=2721559 RepID=UPI001431F76D|nr:P-loop NTPase fold protein [Pseudoalteromonas sp. HF66]NIZ07042.1 hypothetical protein [Pseudoalteromonas sp. HF66]